MKFEIDAQIQIASTMNKISRVVSDGLEKGAPKAIITISRPKRSELMNRKFHALISDIASTAEVDREYSLDIWKALLVDAFEQELKLQRINLPKPSRTAVSFDGARAVSIRASTTEFSNEIGSMFIEFLYSFGIENGATFTDKSLSYYEEISRG